MASSYGLSGTSLPSIYLCNREGYPSWKFKMRNYLMHEDLWESIEGYSESDKTPIEEINRKDRRALTKICLTMDGQAIIHVRNAKTASEAWNALQNAYEDKGMSRRLSLERRLYRMSLCNYSNLEAYINAVLCTVQDLSDIGKTIDDESVAAILLGGLTAKYEPLIMAIENSNVKVSTELVKNKLLNEMSKDSTNSDVTALRTDNIQKYGKPIVCYECNKEGHKRPDCPLKKKKTIKKKPNIHKESASLLALGITDSDISDKWYVDSGATKHMTSRKDWFEELKPLDCDVKVTVADGTKISVDGVGEIAINNTISNVNKITDVMYVPKLKSNLISVKKAVEKGFSILFDKSGCNFFDSSTFSFTGDSVVSASSSGGLYTLDCTVNEPLTTAYDVHSDCLSPYQLWHKRLGHLCRIGMNQLKDSQVGVEFRDINKNPCIACVEGKQSRKPFKKIEYKKATTILELIHSDLCGPMSVNSFQGNLYVLLFIDDFSRQIFPYFISSKTEVKDKFCHFQLLVERQTGAQIKTIRTDNGTEFVNREMSEYLVSKGIQHQTTVPYSPQQNGVAERTNRAIVEKARSMLAESSLPKAFWEDAFRTAVYLKNRCPHRALNRKTPYEIWNGYKPNLNHLRVFGCRALIHIPQCNRKKLDMKAEEAIFVGYTEDPHTYLFRNASNTRRLVKSRDVTFFENSFSTLKTNNTNVSRTVNEFQSPNLLLSEFTDSYNSTSSIENSIMLPTDDVVESSGPNIDPNDITEENLIESSEDGIDSTNNESGENLFESCEDGIDSACNESERRYPSRERKPPDYLSYQVAEETAEPKSFTEATKSEDCDKWKIAMNSEYNSLMELKTWELVDRQNKKIIPCKWVYKVKKDPIGNIIKYKARLVAKGFNQTSGVDYFETFSPVVRHSSLRSLLAIAAELGLKMRHMDVDTAFLNGKLEEEVFMEQPQGFKVKGQENKICLLRKSLYGLKQAPRAWNKRLNECLSLIGFHRTPSEPCVYTKLFGSELVILSVFVDDIICFYKNEKSFETVITDLKKYFSLKDLGYLSNYLGLQIEQKDFEVRINQKPYIEKLLKKYGMCNASVVTTPLNGKLEVSSNCNEQSLYPYQELIGCLMYLSVNTRPDISYATSYLSQFNTRYNKTHWLAAKRVLQYLKGTIDYTICYKKSGQPLLGFADADWANCPIDRRSYTGYCFTLAGGPVSWASRKQQTVALSSAEAEYMAIAEATKEAIYLKRFISEVCVSQVSFLPTSVCISTDSQSAQNLALNPVHHHRTKHIDTRYHFIREKLGDGIISLKYTKSCEMPADVLTKPLQRVAHRRCLLGLGLIPVT